jgi:pimeloyl-ACP methyl ester carboxylesterase
MGAFATLKHYDQLADTIANTGKYQVLSFDYRGIGQSTCQHQTRQTSLLLAQDTLALINHLWRDEKIHVYGGSMGGMVAQILSTLIPERVKTLHLAVTARQYGNARFIPIGATVYRWVLPWVVASTPSKMIASMIPKCFDAEYRNSIHSGTDKTIGELWQDRWTREYTQWFSFGDLDASAAQSTVAGLHYLSDAGVAIIKKAKIPVLVTIAEGDDIMSPSLQHELANVLDARKRISKRRTYGQQE